MTPTEVDQELEIFERLVVSPEAARAVLAIDFSPQDIQRAHELRERNTKGLLSAQERTELDAYVRIGDFLTIMHSKARQLLKSTADSLGTP